MRLFTALTLSTILLYGCSAKEPAVERPATPSPAQAVNGVVEVKVAAEFTPSTISVTKGQPLQLRFVRGSEPSCGDEVVFPALNIRKKIPENSTTVVDLTPAQTGTIAFTCGMNMMKGAIVVQ